MNRYKLYGILIAGSIIAYGISFIYIIIIENQNIDDFNEKMFNLLQKFDANKYEHVIGPENPTTRIMHITDGHYGNTDTDYLLDHKIMKKMIEKEDPDYLFYTGDLMNGCHNDEVFSWLDSLNVTYFLVAGNHDLCIENVPNETVVDIENITFYLNHYPMKHMPTFQLEGSPMEDVSCDYDICLFGHDHYMASCKLNMCYGGHFGGNGIQYSYRIIEILDGVVTTYSRDIPIVIR